MNTIWLVKCRFEPYGDPEVANVFYACEFVAAETLPEACDIMLIAAVHMVGTYTVEIYDLPTATGSETAFVHTDMVFTQSLTLHPTQSMTLHARNTKTISANEQRPNESENTMMEKHECDSKLVLLQAQLIGLEAKYEQIMAEMGANVGETYAVVKQIGAEHRKLNAISHGEAVDWANYEARERAPKETSE